MIRPRIGDFLYSKPELMVMLEDIHAFKDIGNIRGFVLGVLTKDGRVDVECTKMQVTSLPSFVCKFSNTILGLLTRFYHLKVGKT